MIYETKIKNILKALNSGLLEKDECIRLTLLSLLADTALKRAA